ncbi:MAG: DUF4403 family protein [Gammaproteobacteria bacterium]|nr:DUF4403 family protein [Gammaproteobacteria bacterium]
MFKHASAALISFLLLLSIALLAGCQKDSGPVEVSEPPSELPADTRATSAQSTSQMGIRARITFDDLTSFVASELPDTHSGTGTKRECRKVIGLKLCGTGQWTYTVERRAAPTIGRVGDALSIALPLNFYGTAGIEGDVARALQLSDLDFRGALNTRIDINIDMDQNWCPVFHTNASYEWLESPVVAWAGGLEFNVQDHLDKAIRDQLASLSESLNDKVDCQNIRQQLAEHWRSYSFPLQVLENDTLYLNLEPTGFAFSGVKAEPERVGVAFVLSALTQVESAEMPFMAKPLPVLERVDYAPGATSFNVLIRLDYTLLQKITEQQIVGTTYESTTKAGDVSVLIDALEFSATQGALVVKLDFTAELPAVRSPSKGTLYLTSIPVADPVANTVMLVDTKLSKVLDSPLWSVISSIFENQIITAIEKNSVMDLTSQLQQLQQRLQNQLQNPDTAAGLEVMVDELNIDLVNLTPEPTALAAEVQVSAQLDVGIPLSALQALSSR